MARSLPPVLVVIFAPGFSAGGERAVLAGLTIQSFAFHDLPDSLDTVVAAAAPAVVIRGCLIEAGHDHGISFLPGSEAMRVEQSRVRLSGIGMAFIDGAWKSMPTFEDLETAVFHMLVVGKKNNYSSFGGVVVGDSNDASGAHANVLGGAYNTASNTHAIVVV